MFLGLTNDDGYESPINVNFISDLTSVGYAVNSLFPCEEMSWCSQRATRFSDLTIQNIAGQNNSESIKALNGTPADCASLLVEHFGIRDILISGVNMGTNASDAFYFSSGTIGAARQAAFYGVKSIAMSWTVPPLIYKKWKEGNITTDDFNGDFRWVSIYAAAIIKFLEAKIDWTEIHHISVNLPIEKPTIASFTSLSTKKFGSLYEKLSDNTYRFKFGGLVDVTKEEHSDWESSITRSEVSITRFKKDFSIDLINLGRIEELSKNLSIL